MEDKLLARVHSFESFGAVDGPGICYISIYARLSFAM